MGIYGAPWHPLPFREILRNLQWNTIGGKKTFIWIKKSSLEKSSAVICEALSHESRGTLWHPFDKCWLKNPKKGVWIQILSSFIKISLQGLKQYVQKF